MKTISTISCLSAVCLAFFSAGCDYESSGNCTGKIDGDLYQLQVYNCTASEMLVKVNGRKVGRVEQMDDTLTCGVTYLGTFPQCTNGVIDAYAYETVTQRILWSEEDVSNSVDGCWVVGIIVDSDTDEEAIVLPGIEDITGPACNNPETEAY